MVFSSIVFIFYFLPVVLLVYYLAPDKAKNVVLLIASLVFYAWGAPDFFPIFIASMICNFLIRSMAVSDGFAAVILQR